MRLQLIVIPVMVALVLAGCSYSLPSPLQGQVDDIVQQTAGVQQVASQIKSGNADSAAKGNVERRYGELVRAHDVWREQVERVINNEINNFESDERYNNAVDKLTTASNEFVKAADAARMSDAPTTVPDWPAEARDLIVRAYNERKHKQAAVAIAEMLRMKPWAEL